MAKKLTRYLPDIIIIICLVATLGYRLYWLFAWLLVPYAISLLAAGLINKYSGTKTKTWFRFAVKVCLITAYSIICKLYVFDIYRVSGDSMEGTLKQGDVLLINKLAYGPLELENLQHLSWYRLFNRAPLTNNDETCRAADRKKGYTDIKQNDIVVYEFLPGVFVVKRCVALPGDTLFIRNDSAYINDRFIPFSKYSVSRYKLHFSRGQGVADFLNTTRPQDILLSDPDSNYIIANLSLDAIQKWASNTTIKIERQSAIQLEGKTPYFLPATWSVNNMGPMIIPFKGFSVKPDSTGKAIYQQTILNETCSDKSGETIATKNTYTFKEDYYFLLGDNKPGSEDSRYQGYIPGKHIIGKAVLILYSENEGKINRSRFLKLLH